MRGFLKIELHEQPNMVGPKAYTPAMSRQDYTSRSCRGHSWTFRSITSFARCSVVGTGEGTAVLVHVCRLIVSEERRQR